jgi:hypothetical protein
MGKDPSREKQKDKLRGQTLKACTFSLVSAEYCKRRKQDGDKPWAPAGARPLLDQLAGHLRKVSPASKIVDVKSESASVEPLHGFNRRQNG